MHSKLSIPHATVCWDKNHIRTKTKLSSATEKDYNRLYSSRGYSFQQIYTTRLNSTIEILISFRCSYGHKPTKMTVSYTLVIRLTSLFTGDVY